MINAVLAESASLKRVTISPLSVSFALAMLANGADAETRKDLCLSIGIDNPEELNSTFSTLMKTVIDDSDWKNLTIANAIFSDRTFKIYPKYAESLESFRAYSKTDFSTLVEGIAVINNWIYENTNKMIKDMLKTSHLRLAHVALVNALAFKGVWKNQFNPSNTKHAYPFHSTNNTTRPTDMMFLRNSKVLLARGNSYQAIRLPYAASSDSSQMSFIAYLPDENVSIEQTLQQIQSEDIPQFQQTKLSELGFPRLNIETSLEIFQMLKQLGFSISGNFTEMGNGPNLVNTILHNAVVKLDERGTEAAAATVIVMTRSRPVNPPPSLIFDRPFAFSIVLDSTKLVVFAGLFTVE
jgi:serine protease inhibitor